MKRSAPTTYFLAGVIAAFFIISQFSFKEEKNNHKEVRDSLACKWIVPSVPSEFSFAGEKVPLGREDIHEQFDHNLTMIYYETGTMLNLLKLTSRWFPLIEERLKYNGVPTDFKYLCVAESNLQNLISRVGAVGFWQFMGYTAPGYNLQVDASVDERYNVIRSTDAACNYLKQAHQMFGSWTAAASYNCGRGRYHEQSVFQSTNNYYDLQLPEETNRYMYRILSFKYIIENAKALGFDMKDDQYYKPYRTKTITVSSTISNLSQFARSNGTNYRMLRLLNPWLRGRSLSIRNRTYQLLLPAE